MDYLCRRPLFEKHLRLAASPEPTSLDLKNPVFGKSQCSGKFFLWEIWVDYVRNVCKQIVYCCIYIPLIWPTLFLQRFKLNISSISHQQAVAVHWDLTNTDIFQSKDVASDQGIHYLLLILRSRFIIMRFRLLHKGIKLNNMPK
jgi:hypothetical protein